MERAREREPTDEPTDDGVTGDRRERRKKENEAEKEIWLNKSLIGITRSAVPLPCHK